MNLGKTIDSMIFSVAPGWGGRRLLARRSWEFRSKWLEKRDKQLSAHFDGADDNRIRADRWRNSGLSPDSALEQDLESLRNRSRELYRDDPYAHSFVESRTSNIIGRGIRGQSAVRPEPGMFTEEQARVYRDALNKSFKMWAQSAGQNETSLWEVQRMVQRRLDIDGEAFVLLRTDKSKTTGLLNTLPLTIEVIDAERVETPPSEHSNPLVRMGVRKSEDGEVLGYYVRRSVSGDSINFNQEHDYIEARAANGLKQFIHIFEPVIPGQSRGVPLAVAAINSLKDRLDYDQTTMIAEQSAACFAAFVKTSTPADDLAAASASAVDGRGNRLQDIDPGTVTYLNQDEDVTFSNPNRPSATFAPFMEYNLRKIGAALQHPYELLAKDWSNTTYSSGRLSLIDGRITFGCRQQLLSEQLLDPIWKWVTTLAAMNGDLPISVVEFRSDPQAYWKARWITPGWPWIDPDKEVKASAHAVEAGLSTRTNELATRGLDFEEVVETLAAEKQVLKDLDLAIVMPLMQRPEDQVSVEADVDLSASEAETVVENKQEDED